MKIKKKNLNFIAKSGNPSFLVYNLNRWYFTNRLIYLNSLINEKAKNKKEEFLLSTNINLDELKIPKINKYIFQNIYKESRHSIINKHLKNDQLKKKKPLNEKKKNYLFYNQTVLTNRITPIENIYNVINNNIKVNNGFYNLEIKKGIHTINNEKSIKCKKENSEVNGRTQTVLNYIKKENNVVSTDANKTVNKALNNIETENINKELNNVKTTNINIALDNIETKQIKERIKINKGMSNVTNNIINKKHIIKGKNIVFLNINNINLLLNKLFEKYLLLMNCVVAGILYFTADLVCQFMEIHKKNKEYDFLRTLRMSFIGMSLEGPVMTWWYGKILYNYIKTKPNIFFYKSFLPTIFDIFFFGPIHLVVFFFYNGMLKNQKQIEIIDKIVNTGINVFFVSLVTWTPITLINFFFVPRIYQASVVFCVDFFWVIFLSWCANKKE